MKTLLTSAFLLIISCTFAQQSSLLNIGLGVGLDYGGIGTRTTLTPNPQAGIFIALGYNLDELGYNFGANYKFTEDNKVNPYITAMYGYNGVIILSINGETAKETYYGVTIGGGIEIVPKSKKSSWNIEMLVPLRREFNDDVEILNEAGFDVNNPWPVTFCIGYHFRINTAKKAE